MVTAEFALWEVKAFVLSKASPPLMTNEINNGPESPWHTLVLFNLLYPKNETEQSRSNNHLKNPIF